jgi:CRP/FNR family cyclic AMP-dependent transcriptional regulator
MSKTLSIWQFPLFSDLEESDIMMLLQHSETRHHRTGSIVFREGDQPDGLHIVLSGELQFYVSGPGGKKKVIGSAKEGDYVGEFSLLDGLPRSANVEAVQDSEVLLLSMASFGKLLQERPSIARDVRAKLVEFVKNLTGKQVAFDPNANPSKAELSELCRILREYDKDVASRD